MFPKYNNRYTSRSATVLTKKGAKETAEREREGAVEEKSTNE
jgi:hypothetical protein